MIHITDQDVSYNQYFRTFFIVYEVVCRWRCRAAPATNEVTLIALEFHLKPMIPSGGPNLAPHPRRTPGIGIRGTDSGINSSFFVSAREWWAWALSGV